MFLMIYTRLRLLYFCLGTILQEDSVGADLGAALCWCSDSELADSDKWAMWDHRHWYILHFSSPDHCLSNLKASHHLWVFCFFFQAEVWAMLEPPHSLLRLTLWCPRAEEREGEGEKEMEVEGGGSQTKSFRHCEETHTSLCFNLSAW